MRTITVGASKSYSVVIGTGLLDQLGVQAATVSKCCKAAIISDSNVWPLYGEMAAQSLRSSGFEVVHFVFPSGESSKNADTYLQILNFLAENKLTRSDMIVALGGGVVGDISGFAAATYLRGIAYVQVPTTLLAMVDSSVGGKTAIDLPTGKNLVGAFYQPNLVVCDPDVLNTLPEETFRDGCAEVIKYGVLYDPGLFSHLQQKALAFDRTEVIARCVEWKRNVVMEDEFDTGVRQLLNLGHTFGHAIEAKSAFSVTHGQAVAIGMHMAAKAAVSMGLCHKTVQDDIDSILQRFSLPISTQFSAFALREAALSDKKRSGGSVNLILPRAIGKCEIFSTPVETLQTVIEAGL